MKPKKARDLGPFEAVHEALRGFALGSGWSDRNAAVIATATAEAVLQVLLMSYFAREDHVVDKAFETAFSNLSARIDVAYCIGIIDEDLATNLRHLASIRNIFAHDITVMLFSHERVLPKLEDLGVAVSKDDRTELHQAFIRCVGEIFSKLYRVALFVWWKAGSIPVLALPSDAKWDRMMNTDLSQLNEIAADDSNTLVRFGIKKVADILSVKHPLLLGLLDPEEDELLKSVYLWVVSELDKPDE